MQGDVGVNERVASEETPPYVDGLEATPQSKAADSDMDAPSEY